MNHTSCLAVLVETAFIDNTVDAKLLVESEDDFAGTIGDVGKCFAISEFVCHCCGGSAEKINSRLIELLEQLRAKADVPIHVNCGYRCPSHNAEVGGVPNSQHELDTAADITIPQIGFDRAARGSLTLMFAMTGKVLKKNQPFRNWRGFFVCKPIDFSLVRISYGRG